MNNAKANIKARLEALNESEFPQLLREWNDWWSNDPDVSLDMQISKAHAIMCICDTEPFATEGGTLEFIETFFNKRR